MQIYQINKALDRRVGLKDMHYRNRTHQSTNQPNHTPYRKRIQQVYQTSQGTYRDNKDCNNEYNRNNYNNGGFRNYNYGGIRNLNNGGNGYSNNEKIDIPTTRDHKISSFQTFIASKIYLNNV